MRDENRHEIAGLLMISFGILLALSLTPPRLVEGIFSHGVGAENLAGPVGAYLAGRVVGLLGRGAYLAPPLIVVWGGARFLDRSPRLPLRLTFLLLGGSILLSTAVAIQTGRTEGAGRLPEAIASWLPARIGWLGSLLLLYAFGLVLLLLTTRIRIEPVVARLASAMAGALDRAGAFARDRAAEAISWRAERRARRRRETEKRVRKRLGERMGTRREIDGKREPPGPAGRPPGEKRTPRAGVPAPTETAALPPEPPVVEGGYRLPSLDLLHAPPGAGAAGTEHDASALARVLVDTLADFHIRGEVVDIVTGPVITMFELKPAPGVKVSQIQNLADDLAMAMRARRIRVVAPIPGKGAVGIEIPNPTPETVLLREIIGSEPFRWRQGILTLPLGKDTVGSPVVADLAGMPHLLIAGATGSGKSVSIHCLVTGFLYRFPPGELSLIMIDPKMLELGTYNGIPHLLVPVVTDPKEAVKTLRWAVREMEERYTLLSTRGVRSIPEYNRRISEGGDRSARRLPYLVIIIDELADLILTMQNEVEEPLARLAQMARGVGIHLILATQRPSVDVITGMIKANFPSRISFRVASKIDSRTILDANGAEKLLGKGDMLYLPGGSASPVRIHGAFISGEELEAVVGFVRGQLDVWRPETPAGSAIDPGEFEAGPGCAGGERDDLFEEAARLVVRYGHGSTSLLQRRLKIGYTRAARIVDQLEAAAVVGPPDGSKAREVLIDESKLEEMGIP